MGAPAWAAPVEDLGETPLQRLRREAEATEVAHVLAAVNRSSAVRRLPACWRPPCAAPLAGSACAVGVNDTDARPGPSVPKLRMVT